MAKKGARKGRKGGRKALSCKRRVMACRPVRCYKRKPGTRKAAARKASARKTTVKCTGKMMASALSKASKACKGLTGRKYKTCRTTAIRLGKPKVCGGQGKTIKQLKRAAR
jgi:hypothetical protein